MPDSASPSRSPRHVAVGLADVEAHAAFERYERLRPPDADFAYYLAAHVRLCMRQEDADHWVEGYRKAGLAV